MPADIPRFTNMFSFLPVIVHTHEKDDWINLPGVRQADRQEALFSIDFLNLSDEDLVYPHLLKGLA